MRELTIAGHSAHVAERDGATRGQRSHRVAERLLMLQRTVGNRAVTRLLAREGETVAEQPQQDPIAPWVADGMKKQPELGRVLGLLRELMGPYWRYVEQVTWVGTRGEAVFKPTDQEGLHRALLDKGYTSDYFAKRGSDKWGVREPRKSGAALHWRGNADGTVNVHIDLEAPSGTGLWHWIQDDVRRSATHTPDSLEAGVKQRRAESALQRSADGSASAVHPQSFGVRVAGLGLEVRKLTSPEALATPARAAMVLQLQIDTQAATSAPTPTAEPRSPVLDAGAMRAEAARRLVRQLQDKKAVYGHETVTKTVKGATWEERKEGWWWEETEFDCSKFALWVLAGRQVGEQVPKEHDVRTIQVAPFGRILDASSVSAMLSIVDQLVKAGKANPIRTDQPGIGDLIFWTGHVGIVVEVKQDGDDTWIIFAHMGTSGAAELGKAGSSYWLNVSEIADKRGLARGTFLGFWTP